MKTRIVWTDLWYENAFSDLSKEGKLLILYLITCPFIELTGIFKLPRKHILLETGLTEDELKLTLSELEEVKKVFLYKEWIYVTKTEKNKFNLGRKTGKGFERELEKIPQDIFRYFVGKYSYHIPTIHEESINKKTDLIRKKAEYLNKDSEHINDNAENSESINPNDIPF